MWMYVGFIVFLFGIWGFPIAMIYQGIGGLLAIKRAKAGMPLYKVFLYWFYWPVMYFTDRG